MENYKEEIAKRQTQLDELKSKIEKPKFKVGWLKLTKYNVFCYTTDFKSGYGISHKDTWTDKMFIDDLAYWEQATPKEVQEALTKEAIKRYKGKKFRDLNGSGINNFNTLDFDHFQRHELIYNSEGEPFYKKGIWATPIKTKTIDELVDEIECNILSYSMFPIKEGIKRYMSNPANKQTIIETLNNL